MPTKATKSPVATGALLRGLELGKKEKRTFSKHYFFVGLIYSFVTEHPEASSRQFPFFYTMISN